MCPQLANRHGFKAASGGRNNAAPMIARAARAMFGDVYGEMRIDAVADAGGGRVHDAAAENVTPPLPPAPGPRPASGRPR
jgi:hypothetical protein